MTSASATGSDQATRLAGAALPLKTVLGSGSRSSRRTRAAALSVPRREKCSRPRGLVSRSMPPCASISTTLAGLSLSTNSPSWRFNSLGFAPARVHNTWFRAGPSARLWCTRPTNAQPLPYESIRWNCHSGRERSRGVLSSAMTTSCKAASSPGGGSIARCRWCPRSKPGSSSQWGRHDLGWTARCRKRARGNKRSSDVVQSRSNGMAAPKTRRIVIVIGLDGSSRRNQAASA